jgi:hypothetical protein
MCSGYYIFDFLSVFPGLVGNKSQNFRLYAFKLTRFVHTYRFFKLFGAIMNRFLITRGYNIMKARDYVWTWQRFSSLCSSRHIY